MAKADEESTEWLPVSQALRYVTEVEGSKDLADRLLRDAIRDGRLPHRIGVAFIGRHQREVRNEPASDGFWPRGSFWDWPTVVDLAKSYAIRKPHQFFEAHRIEVYIRALQKLWPKIRVENNAPAERAASRRGRRSSEPLVLAEATTRLQGSDRHIHVRKGRKKFLQGLADWLPKTHPNAKRMASKTIGDHIRRDDRVRALLPPEWQRRK